MSSSNIRPGYDDGDIDTNFSGNPSLQTLIDERYSRRQTLFGGISATAMALFGTSLLAACGEDENDTPVVNAGQNGSSSSGRVVTLSGTATDKDGIASSSWTQTSGPTVTLEGANTATAKFLAPSVSGATELKVRYSGTDFKGVSASAETTVTINPAALGFTSIAKNRNDVVTVPAGYTVTVMTRLGDPIAAGIPAYANNGNDSDFANRIGDHGDALYWYGLNAAGARDDNGSTRGLMVQNHENLNVQYLHPNGPTNVAAGPRPEAEALKEIEAHGVSVVEYSDSGNRTWSYVANSSLNRRITHAGSDAQLYVYHIQNRPAGDLAKVLQGVFQGAVKEVEPSQTAVAPKFASAEVTSAAGAGQTDASGEGTADAPQVAEVPAAANSSSGGRDREPDIQITADEANNTLLIMASPGVREGVEGAAADRCPAEPGAHRSDDCRGFANDELKYGLRWYFEQKNSQVTFSDASGACCAAVPRLHLFPSAPHVEVALNALSSVTTST